MVEFDLEALGRRAFAVSYRMLGSVVEAEDVAQEALLRLTEQGDAPNEPAAWVTTVATRLSIDHLRLARVQREVSDYDYARIAEVVGRSEASCRQLVTRARKHVRADSPRFDVDPDHGQALLERFLGAAEDGDVAALEAMLAEDVVLYGDGGGKVKAATEPLTGVSEVARFLIDIARARRALGEFELELVSVNGHPGRVLRDAERRVWDVLSIDVVDGRIDAVRIVRNPDKLRHL